MSSKIQINKRVKGLPREELEKLSKTELIDKIIQLEAYNFQLKNILNKKLDENDDDLRDELKELNQLNDQCKTEKPEDVNNKNAIEDSTEGSPENPNAVGNKKNKKREFDFSKCVKMWTNRRSKF